MQALKQINKKPQATTFRLLRSGHHIIPGKISSKPEEKGKKKEQIYQKNNLVTSSWAKFVYITSTSA